MRLRKMIYISLLLQNPLAYRRNVLSPSTLHRRRVVSSKERRLSWRWCVPLPSFAFVNPMESSRRATEAESAREIFQRLMSEDSSGGWEKTWEVGAIPWDLGKATPIVVHLCETGSLPNGRALVPGCGTGYDVVAMASPDRHVIGLDVSKTAIERSSKMFSSLPNAKHFSFLSEDFFTWEPAEKFDLIFDYTFFCAFEPGVRPKWAQRMEQLLKPGGELITLMFPIDERPGGPPYKVSVSDYEQVLIPLGFEATSIVDNELAVGPRKGLEKLGRWKKSPMFHSTL